MPWIHAIVGLLVGTIIGVVVSRLTTPGYKKQKSVQKELESAKFELEQQRQELVDHFAQSAEMLDTLGKDYTKLYQHFAKTSSELLPNLPEQDNPFDMKTAMTAEQISEDQPDLGEQPKDYASGATGLLKDQEKEIINAPEAITAKAS
ncbi:Z-ring associated protein ZapG [Vibrio alginolyticus]|uniref:Z-ring associated protein ZapG n=1 Tax=Vibrio sp. B1FLJ16 TaxID=2751178 RepID=UPI0015F5B26C|nr:Z-ring associated protein ZapG [Vibrio sp. B1FLJ16]CAD7798956.1 Inner membrane protein YhcB [Vibrio sp. B1FLJ16]CAE6885002.1 Inner membrane protein YhcB [Vibrio sp. B1FLJ16]